ncbi:uncharacterized protein LOC125500573 isoform X2 [Athalia rosae]|uniref:uncharacterized protein LOC125500573 isoform X2 n=1 Tax=Athalia rosae TaxID=37344 RepID=UPI002033BA19|nr:uncharacterized protein LOC125500573 isoform X2 [Athalia rosae]
MEFFKLLLGAMDGKHITIQAPNKSGSQYFNYKKSFSIILLAGRDANYMFTMVDVGAVGSQSDGGVPKESVYGKALDQNISDVPESTSLPGTNTRSPYFFVADKAFPLKNYIMQPYPADGEYFAQILLPRLKLLKELLCNNCLAQLY